ncbi:MAG: hypothetical protein KDH95_19520 [Calditrichaeota bacterium]|nr:hypothetical protein [Calditrichota bacterium]
MKKYIAIVAAVLCLFASQNGMAREISGYGARGIIALPSGNLSNVAGTGIGGIGTLLYEFDDNLVFSGSVGFISMGSKEVASSVFFSELNWDYSYKIIPITTGARYYLKPEGEGLRPYVGGDIGYYIYSVSVEDANGVSVGSVSGTSNFGIAPAVGFQMGILDVQANYSLADFNYLGLSVGVMLGKK